MRNTKESLYTRSRIEVVMSEDAPRGKLTRADLLDRDAFPVRRDEIPVYHVHPSDIAERFGVWPEQISLDNITELFLYPPMDTDIFRTKQAHLHRTANPEDGVVDGFEEGFEEGLEEGLEESKS